MTLTANPAPFTLAQRADAAPSTHLVGFDKEQNVFVYGQAQTPTGQARLFFPLETYYPDATVEDELPTERLAQVVSDYETYLLSLTDGQDPNPEHPAMVAYQEATKSVRTGYYFSTVRLMLDRLIAGLAPDEVLRTLAPASTTDALLWADHEAAFFDATGLLAILDQVDLPRMGADSVFNAWRKTATPAQIQTAERLLHPELFDLDGTALH